MALSFRKYYCSLLINCRKYLYKYDRRNLFSEADLKLDRFLRQRIFKTDDLGTTGKDAIIQKLERIKTPREAKQCLHQFVDLIHVAENKEDLQIIKSVMQLLSKSDISSLDNFNYGASVLRSYYLLGLPLEAYSLYMDPECHSAVKDITCHRILMDLLYCHNLYQEVLNVFGALKKFNIDCITLALAAHYHIDTHESYLAAESLINENHELPRRALLFFCMLCINQRKPEKALEVLDLCKDYSLLTNIELIALAKLGRSTQIMEILEKMKYDSGNVQAPFICRLYSDTMKDIELTLKEKLSQKEFANYCILLQDLSERAVLSRQTIHVLLERIIPGNVSHRKTSGKQKVIRDFFPQ